jgi:cell wall-associated NlpC family hydrolase
MGGASPKGFDCSGFVWFVYQKVTGMDLGRTVEAQWDQGSSVSRGQLSPGDVVFFKNTFGRGLSHDGISLGGTQFIHAENEGTGVVISDLSSGYYDEHYAGARRLV